jgi:hypothetical protein
VRLEETPLPEGAEERGWRVVRAAFEERVPAPVERRLWRPVVVLAAVAVVAGAVASPPGQAVLDSIREAVGIERAQPALFSLPAAGRLLVESDDGAWVVQPNGSKRRLGDWREASWSPFGRYVVVAKENELAAVEPDGDVRWSIARPTVRFPRWGGDRTDTRIAYLSGPAPRIVAGDGTGDHTICFTLVAPVPPVWKPGRHRALAIVARNQAVYALEPDGCQLRWRSLDLPRPRRLEWSSDGGRLLVLDRNGAVVLRRGKVVSRFRSAVAATFLPRTHDVALIRRRGMSSEVVLGGRILFRGTGEFRDVATSPDGHWLLVTWPTADQWVFVRMVGGRKIEAVSDITKQFGGGTFPRIAGWCCSS